MLTIPDDLYPIPPFQTISHIVDEYMRFTCETYPDDFPNLKSLQNYLSRMCSPRDAEKFIEIGKDLYLLTQQKDTSIRLILLVAEIEKTISPKYSNFQSWFLSKNSEVDKILKSLGDVIRNSSNEEIKNIINDHFLETFNKDYGILNLFANFFEKYVSPEEQFKLITGFNFVKKEVAQNYTSRHEYQPQVNTISELKQEGIIVTKSYVPKCYNWKMCHTQFLGCHPEEGCIIKENPIEYSKTIRWLAKTIYSMRSEIVHEASNKTILSGNSSSVNRTGATFSYIMIRGKSALITLNFDEIQKIFAKAIKRFFDEKLIPE